MNVSLQWLGDHVDFSEYSIQQLDELLTFAGIEVEGIESLPNHLVVAQILSSDKHPDAEKLSVCQVDDGSGTPRQIVCGAKNYEVGDKVPLALPGCVLDAGGGKSFEIKEGKLRGVDSLGMMCSAKELGLAEDADGVLILSPDLKPGTPMAEVYPAVFELEITPNRPDCLSHLGVSSLHMVLAILWSAGVYYTVVCPMCFPCFTSCFTCVQPYFILFHSFPSD
jgi:phenylalanyl-tRNA synthetase beta chain